MKQCNSITNRTQLTNFNNCCDLRKVKCGIFEKTKHMEYKIDHDSLENALDGMEQLLKDLTERISDLHEVKGGMQARHAYCYYRHQLWAAMQTIKDNAKPINASKKIKK